MTETQQPVAKFLQGLTDLKEKIKPYLSSFKCALAYVVEIENRITLAEASRLADIELRKIMP